MKGVSINDIAKELGLSYTTVCKTLNKDPKHRVSKETKAKIFKKAREMKYDFSSIHIIHKRQSERIEVNIPARIKLKSTNSRKLFDKGSIMIKNISKSGVLITDIKLKKNCLPLKPFICELSIFNGRLKGIRLKGEPVRIGNNGDLHLGLSLADVPERYMKEMMSVN